MTRNTKITYDADDGRYEFTTCAAHYPQPHEFRSVVVVSTEATDEPCMLACAPTMARRLFPRCGETMTGRVMFP